MAKAQCLKVYNNLWELSSLFWPIIWILIERKMPIQTRIHKKIAKTRLNKGKWWLISPMTIIKMRKWLRLMSQKMLTRFCSREVRRTSFSRVYWQTRSLKEWQMTVTWTTFLIFKTTIWRHTSRSTSKSQQRNKATLWCWELIICKRLSLLGK